MRRILAFLKPYTKELFIGPSFKLVEAVLELLLPTIMALIINNGVAQRDSGYVLRMGGLMLLMSLLGIGSSVICQYTAARTSQGFGTALRNAVFAKISAFSHADIDRFGVTTLTNRVTSDINQLQLAVAMLIRLVIRAPFITVGAVVMAMLLNFRLSVVLLIAAPLLALILYLVISKSAPIYTIYQKTLDKLSGVLRENLSGVRVIRAFTKTAHEKKRFQRENDELTAAAIRVSKLSALLNPLTSFVMNAAVIAVLWVGNRYIQQNTLDVGTIVAFVNYLSQMLIAMIVVSNLVIIFTKAYASAQRVEEVLAVWPFPDFGMTELTELDRAAPALQFEKVSFRYELDDENAVEEISFEIEQGRTLGIIGVTGSGKSTLVNLIGRYYDTTHGDIYIGGAHLKELKVFSLRKLIGLVPQKAELFSGTIAENIAHGKPSASMEEIEAAAAAAQAAEFVNKLPDGYQTKIGRGGAGLSGGQRQRIAIARALIRKPPILILDDATSALDYLTEKALRRSLAIYTPYSTTIIVSQRSSSVRACDKIVVLDDGRIAGQGTHGQLMETCSVYANICRSQNEGGGSSEQ